MVAYSECRRSGKLGGRVIERASLEDHAARGGMNKKVRQLSTDNKMSSVHQQDVDPEMDESPTLGAGQGIRKRG